MYAGIVQGLIEVQKVEKKPHFLQYSVKLTQDLLEGLALGASVSIDGVCQTVVKIDGSEVFFDAIQETLEKTTLDTLHPGRLVNVERSLKYGDEIGGHLMAGHVYGTGKIEKIESGSILTIRCPKEWIPYILTKGFIAIDGVSLTIGNVHDETFQLHLIPETLKRTTLGFKKEKDPVNIELDHQTMTIVDTIRKIQAES